MTLEDAVRLLLPEGELAMRFTRRFWHALRRA